MIGNILAGAIESPAAPTKPDTIEIIVQAGGGGGGGTSGGAGGAGGLIHASSFSVTTGNTYNLTVGTHLRHLLYNRRS